MKENDYQTITHLLDHKTQLENELSQAERSKTFLLPKIDRLKSTLKEAKNAIPGLQAAVDKGASHYQGQLKHWLDQTKVTETDLSKANQELGLLDAQIAELKRQIIASVSRVSLANVLEHQNTISATQGDLANFQNLIADQQRAITEANHHTDTVAPLINQREELLTDIALGEDKSTDLEQLDQQIEVSRQEQDNQLALSKKTIAAAQQTIAGLNRRMAETQDKLNRLNRLTPQLLDLFVMMQAEQAAKDFTALADQIIQKMHELITLEALVSDIGIRQDSGLFLDPLSMLTIPCISGVSPLDSLNGAPGVYARIVKAQFPVAEAMRQIKRDMVNQGITI